MNHISEILSDYDNLLASHNKTNELNDRFEVVECDHRNLMKHISDYIFSDELDKDDLSSNSTRYSSKCIDELECKKIEIKKIKTLENLEAADGTLNAINKIEKE